MMVSLNTPIATKPHLTRDRTLNKHKLLMYLSFENMTEEQAVSEMRTVCTLLVQFIDTSDNNTQLTIINKLESLRKMHDTKYLLEQKALREVRQSADTLTEILNISKNMKKTFTATEVADMAEDDLDSENTNQDCPPSVNSTSQRGRGRGKGRGRGS